MSYFQVVLAVDGDAQYLIKAHDITEAESKAMEMAMMDPNLYGLENKHAKVIDSWDESIEHEEFVEE